MEIPENIRKIVYKIASNETLTDEERRLLVDFLDSRNISVKKLLEAMDMYAYNIYVRTLKEVKGLKQQELVRKISTAEERGMISAAVSKAKSIGKLKFEIANRIVSEHYATALELGYPETEEGIATFFKDAVNFYVNNLGLQEDYEDLKAVTAGLLKMMKPEFKTMTIMKLIKTIALEALKMSAEGKHITKEDLDTVLMWVAGKLRLVGGEHGTYS